MPALTANFETSSAFGGGLAWPLSRALVLANGHAVPEPATCSDEDLMRRYRTGDARAFDELYRRHRIRLYRFVGHMTASRADADEIFQDVWIAVIRGSHRYAPTARFVTYLLAIAHRRATDRRRRHFRWPFQPIEKAEEIASPEDGPLSAACNAQLAGALRAAIAALPLAQREAFLMQAEAGLTIEEIVEATQAPAETVKSRLRYANAKLRAALEPWR